MEYIRNSSEDEMIAIFLKTEITSLRFKDKLKKVLTKFNVNEQIILNYDINNQVENLIRRRILSEYRGYNDKDFFENFPNIDKWEWIGLSKDEILKIKYIDYDYWVELSNGSRLPKDAASNILNGVEIYNISNKGFIDALKSLRCGKKFPPLILVKAYESNYYVILEGHMRITTYALDTRFIKEGLEVIVGYAKLEDFKKWGLY